MAEDGKRRRGKKRGRGSQRPPHSRRPEEQKEEEVATPEEEAPEASTESSEPAESSGGRSFFRRGGSDDVEEEEKPKKRERARAGVAQASPMDFWRRGEARPYREAADRQRSMSLWKRITGLYFPPWVPVVAIIGVVFGFLVLLFFAREATGAPRIGEDHWHASYEYIVCGVKQPNFPTWSGGVHTHADGFIHIHPQTPAEEGAGARLVRWFEYGGGQLDSDTVRAPGTNDEYNNGDECPNGEEGFVQVFVNGQKLEDFSRYIPQDTDEVQIIFGPEREAAVETGNVIPAEEATREVEVEISDSGNPTVDATITPNELSMETGEAVRINITNTGTVSHGLRVAGPDDVFDSDDDFVSDTVGDGESGFVVVRFNEPGEYRFRNANFADTGTGTITVTGEPVQPVNLTISDNGTPGSAEFDPSTINVIAGRAVKLVVRNDGDLSHGISLPGADGELGTQDDLDTGVIDPGTTGEVTFTPEEPGEITFVDLQDPTGTIVVSEEGSEPDPSATPSPDEGGEPVDIELEVGVTSEEGFDPTQLIVNAGERFRIVLTADDENIHNIRIAGPDGEYFTDDDLTTEEDPMDGESSALVGQIDEPGEYEFADSFNQQNTGTLIVE